MKKGFTLIEIIISLTLITILGVSSVVGIKYVNKNIRISKLDEITDKALLAAKVYIETNKETYNQLYNKQNGIIIPLNVLVNEGLLSLENTDLKKSDYEDEYIVTALTDTKGEGCIDITTNASWNLSKDNPIYICSSEKNNLKSIKQSFIYENSPDIYFIKGENPNNWVEFEVTSDNTKVAYFPEEEKDLWRILSIDKDGKIKLFYPGDINCNSNLYYSSDSTSYWSQGSYYTFFKINNIEDIFHSNTYYYYDNYKEFYIEEVIADTSISHSKKNELYKSILNKNWMVQSNYYTDSAAYGMEGVGPLLSSYNSKKDYMGTINSYDIEGTKYYGKTWLSDYSTIIGKYGSREMTIYDKGNSTTTDAYIPITHNGKSTSRLLTYNYHPVITLNEKVELKEQICPEGKELGSKECPYKLECKNC